MTWILTALEAIAEKIPPLVPPQGFYLGSAGFPAETICKISLGISFGTKVPYAQSSKTIFVYSILLVQNGVKTVVLQKEAFGI